MQYQQQTLIQEEIIGRYITHISARHYKYGALLWFLI